MLSNSIDKVFPPKVFNDSPVNNVLLTKEARIYLHPRSVQNQDKYATFDDLFRTYLMKLPNNNVKKYVSVIFQKNMVFIGDSTGGRNEIVFARVYDTGDGRLSGIALDASSLDINISTGETPNIDDCVYATYFGIIRSAVLADVSGIKHDKDLHKILSTYVFHIVMRAIGKRTIYSDKQRALVQLACIYLYYRQFLNERHSMILSIIKKEYSQFFNQDELSELMPSLNTISKYSTLKDIGKALIDLNVFHESPGAILLGLIKILGNSGFYAFVGPLDQLIGMTILCRYPTTLYPKEAAVSSEKIHDTIEQLITKYIDSLGYSSTSLLQGK